VPPVRRDDPYPSHNFQLIVNGISDDGAAVSGAFTEITGLEVALNAIEYRNGSEDTTVRKIPGLRTQTNLVCKRGATGDVVFWNWIKAALDGNVQRAEGAIILNDAQQSEVMRWKFARAWPCKYTGPGFNASTNEMAIEQLEICYEHLELDA
jgi:phage tail-like protein